MLYLNALRALESGDTESAKRELASGAASFYHGFSGLEKFGDLDLEFIQIQKRGIEILAKKSLMLREALEAANLNLGD